jgi:hypothetical protein
MFEPELELPHVDDWRGIEESQGLSAVPAKCGVGMVFWLCCEKDCNLMIRSARRLP